jgi:hypothetical protein
MGSSGFDGSGSSSSLVLCPGNDVTPASGARSLNPNGSGGRNKGGAGGSTLLRVGLRNHTHKCCWYNTALQVLSVALRGWKDAVPVELGSLGAMLDYLADPHQVRLSSDDIKDHFYENFELVRGAEDFESPDDMQDSLAFLNHLIYRIGIAELNDPNWGGRSSGREGARCSHDDCQSVCCLFRFQTLETRQCNCGFASSTYQSSVCVWLHPEELLASVTGTTSTKDLLRLYFNKTHTNEAR